MRTPVERLRALGLALPGVEERVSHREPSRFADLVADARALVGPSR
ncbi:hypothetical protein ACFWP2_13895 [Kitasatospora sp. NPDC058444]